MEERPMLETVLFFVGLVVVARSLAGSTFVSARVSSEQVYAPKAAAGQSEIVRSASMLAGTFC
jgi:hypothetical protein